MFAAHPDRYPAFLAVPLQAREWKPNLTVPARERTCSPRQATAAWTAAEVGAEVLRGAVILAVLALAVLT